MKVAKPVRALWCGTPCQPQPCGPGLKNLVQCLLPDDCGNCS